MALELRHFLLLITAAALLQQPSAVADNNECPYPCYPSPTGGLPSTPPATQTGYNYYPPPAFEYPSPMGGNLPYYPPPTWYGSGGASGGGYGVGVIAPPPPDPILPYFPYYFKNGLHNDHSSSMAADHALPRSTVQILLAILVFYALYFQS